MPMTFTLKVQVQKTQASAAGVSQYSGGQVLDTNNKLVGVFGQLTETITGVTDTQGLNSGWSDLTIFITQQAGHPHGGGGGGGGHHANAPQNLRLQGAVKFEGQHPPTANQPRDIEQMIGSVSAASSQFANEIDHQFVLQGTTLQIM